MPRAGVRTAVLGVAAAGALLTTAAAPARAADAPLPVGVFEQYALTALLKPFSSRASMGTVYFSEANAPGIRHASSLTVEVRALGIGTFKQTLTASGAVPLPRPLWLLPQTVKVTVQPDPPAPGEPRPKALTASYGVQTTNTK